MDRAPNVTAAGVGGRGLWNVEYLITCFADDKVCVSFGLWLLSCSFWFTSSSLHFYLKCKRKSTYNEYVFWDIYSFFGSMCNTIGALLSKQLTIQVITGAYMALADIIHFILTLFPVRNSRHRLRSDRRNSGKKKNHQPILSALSVSLFLGFGCYALRQNEYPYYTVSHAPQRRLLGTALQESTDIVGFTLGIIAVIVSWTVRVPIITKVCRGLVFPLLQIWAIIFSALASIMYTAAIMSHDRNPEYFVRAIPWFLISMGAAAMDVALAILSCMMKNRVLHQMGFVVEEMNDTDTCELLEQGDNEELADGNHKPNDEGDSSWAPIKIVPKRSLSNRSSIDSCVKLSIEPVQENEVGVVRLPGDGQTSPGAIFNHGTCYYPHIPVCRPALVTITKGSSSSSEVSSTNSELEWDFEDFNQQWDFPDINPNESSVMSAGIVAPLLGRK
ncbi:transmembrane protein 44 isoform X2 [Spea bombifrons]|uniref:transmembrane protein 44 isoform X2 n=1 Tax=Spea bombifrons TaxID=233779 RepID=UPI00234B00BA|nr:transmembrane protein 44 isoform X2 [Spea bombifrons]